jgi:hypothetical protein
MDQTGKGNPGPAPRGWQGLIAWHDKARAEHQHRG